MKKVDLLHPSLSKILNLYANGWHLYFGKYYSAQRNVHLIKQRLYSTIEVDIWQMRRDHKKRI